MVSYNPVQSLNARDVTSTVEVIPRSESSDSGDADRCKDSSSASCQKPVTDNTLAIVLGVVIPVVIIALILGYFLYRNYRKDKKEAMDHDPDFDETGEATALPDLPKMRPYGMEDPFDNRNSVRYPQPGDNTNFHKSASSLAPTVHADPYLDNFILPYHHQTGSKASLDDYARQIGEYATYGQGPRASVQLTRTRNSSFSHTKTESNSQQISPLKSSLRTEVRNSNQQSPSKLLNRNTEQHYTNIPNHSTTSLSKDGYYNTAVAFENGNHSDLESISNSVSDDSSSGIVAKNGEKFAVNYENESELAINNSTSSFNQQKWSDGSRQSLDEATTNNSYDTTREHFDDLNRLSISNDVHPDPNIDEIVHEDNETLNSKTATGKIVTSPFDDRVNVRNSNYGDQVAKDDELVDGDFNFSTETSQQDIEIQQSFKDRNNDYKNITATSATENPNNIDLHGSKTKRSKSPRISAFNLLKNDSDEDDEEPDKALSPEQEEELNRMKSVYRVYFDSSNSRHPENDGQQKSDDGNYAFKHDPDQPLPQFAHNKDELRINKDLKMDTNYDKRLTTTSSIYTETPIFANDDQYIYNQQQYATDPNTNYYGTTPQMQQQPIYLPPKQDLPPLQQLPNASDIRKSTIQTYTDFQPKQKNPVILPTAKQPFNPIENDHVWTSPISSPATQSQTSFSHSHESNQKPYHPPVSNNAGQSSVPSATQLSRTSVVMLNPVTEIIKQRKFKPAGSLPSGSVSNHSSTNQSLRYQQYGGIEMHPELTQSENDLIPGNSKRDVRRMMNTNF